MENERARIKVEHNNTLPREYYSSNERIMKIINELNMLRGDMNDFNALGNNDRYGEISARVSKRGFICSADNTSNLENLSVEHFPIVSNYNKEENKIYSWGCSEFMPNSRATVHDGFYKGSNKINCVAHGYFFPINRYYAMKQDEAIIIPKHEEDSFYIIGGSVMDVLQKFLASLNKSLAGIIESSNKKLNAIEQGIC